MRMEWSNQGCVTILMHSRRGDWSRCRQNHAHLANLSSSSAAGAAVPPEGGSSSPCEWRRGCRVSEKRRGILHARARRPPASGGAATRSSATKARTMRGAHETHDPTGGGGGPCGVPHSPCALWTLCGWVDFVFNIELNNPRMHAGAVRLRAPVRGGRAGQRGGRSSGASRAGKSSPRARLDVLHLQRAALSLPTLWPATLRPDQRATGGRSGEANDIAVVPKRVI